jgi:peptidoglycan/LPS O-acetylase OafA/YrhL
MQIVAIQILRAIAAISVSIGHAQAFIAVPMERQGQAFGWSFLLPWGAGVDLFFVISGFIMVYSSERLFAAPAGARIFAWRRLSRIVPLYWCAMALLLVKMAVLHKPMPDAASVVTSFFFIPWDTQGTGVPRPIYDLGWTLN